MYHRAVSYVQVLVAGTIQADHHMQRSAWLGKLPTAPGPQGAALQQALLTCITNAASSGHMTRQGNEAGQGHGAGQGQGPGQGWQLASRPVIAFAVALLEKGNVRLAELADALSGISYFFLSPSVMCSGRCMPIALSSWFVRHIFNGICSTLHAQ